LTIGTGDLWQLALEKWAEISATNPDFEPALALQRQILRLLIDARARLEDSSAPLPDLHPAVVSVKWQRGLPALRGETIPIPPELVALLGPLCDALGGESASHIGHALETNEINGESLLRLSLARNRKAIRTSSLHHGFAPDLMWLLGELASSPLAHYCQEHGGADSFSAWDRGYCAVCGSWPALIELVNGKRLIRCSYCAAAWQLSSRRCLYCGTSDDRFVSAAPDIDEPGRLVDLCGACGAYTKVLAAETAAPFPLIAIEDLASVDLDEGAMSRHYGRPDLIDFDAIDSPVTPGCS